MKGIRDCLRNDQAARKRQEMLIIRRKTVLRLSMLKRISQKPTKVTAA
jgi:hypothetical protein